MQFNAINTLSILFVLPILAISCLRAETVSETVKPGVAAASVQIDVSSVLTTRVITVGKAGAVVTMREDIDGAGGLATQAASAMLGNKNAHPLPDNATFPATDRHPEVVLSYGNEDSTRNQARRSMGQDIFDFPVPAARYAHLYLFCTSGWGASKISVNLYYADHSVERREMEVPDWFWELKPDDSYRSYLATDLGKWDKKNKMVEDNHHFIFSLDTKPSEQKVLVKIALRKAPPGLMVFYGATGTPAPKQD